MLQPQNEETFSPPHHCTGISGLRAQQAQRCSERRGAAPAATSLLGPIGFRVFEIDGLGFRALGFERLWFGTDELGSAPEASTTTCNQGQNIVLAIQPRLWQAASDDTQNLPHDNLPLARHHQRNHHHHPKTNTAKTSVNMQAGLQRWA